MAWPKFLTLGVCPEIWMDVQPKDPAVIKTLRTLRAQRLKKIKIALRDWNFQSRLKISSEPPSKPPFFVGNPGAPGLKFSIEIEIFKRDWNFQSRLIFFNIWALRAVVNLLCFTMAQWLTMATPSCWHQFPWELQAFFLSKKGSQRSKNRGRSKNTTA